MTTRHCCLCALYDIASEATDDIGAPMCLEHHAFIRERVKAEAKQQRPPVIIGGPLSSEQALLLAAAKQLRAVAG
jgi:hypothetical protein